jgi:catechol 2,3-dioxygenase-like lactoylglutathione lyase family enzyme
MLARHLGIDQARSMLFGKLFHVAIRTADLEGSVRFYTEVLGLVLAPRPPIPFPGAWLQPAQADAVAIVHLYAGDAAHEADGSVQCGGGAVDHVSVVCQGVAEFKARFERFGLDYRENLVPGTSIRQLFVHDPNGVMLELSFHADAEHGGAPHIAPQRQYSARERWFDAGPYRQFAAP